MDWFAQPDALVTFGWGVEDLAVLGPTCEVVVAIDVLRFTSCVSVACSRGAVVLPYEWNDVGVDDFAAANDAVVARKQRAPGAWTLSPTDLQGVPRGLRLVLPSPNGSALSFRAARLGCEVIAGCLRNAAAVGEHLAAVVGVGRRVAVLAAGERWPVDGDQQTHGPLRPALEDLLGAGAIIDALASSIDPQALSPEASMARSAFVDAAPSLAARVGDCVSGRELRGRGWSDDVTTCSELSVDAHAPILREGAFR